MKISSDSRNLYLLESNLYDDQTYSNDKVKLYLSHLDLTTVNKDPKNKPYARQPVVNLNSSTYSDKSNFSRRNTVYESPYHERTKAPSVFASNALSLIG
jgi:hypothetical protein